MDEETRESRAQAGGGLKCLKLNFGRAQAPQRSRVAVYVTPGQRCSVARTLMTETVPMFVCTVICTLCVLLLAYGKSDAFSLPA